MNLSKRAREIIEKIRYITVSTVSENGQPWNSPLSSFYDKDFNFYSASWKENQHSKNIKNNPNVFVVIFDSTVPEGTGEGVYFTAKAYELNSKKDIDEALSLRREKHSHPAEDFMGDKPRRIYKFVPEKFWMNEEGNIDGNYIDVRIEVDPRNP